MTSKKPVDLSELEKSILRTGFPLENQISEILKAAEWHVICNKYYIDDQEETIREIDILAYKANKLGPFNVYTALIISCKKSEKYLWALLSREPNLNDPNFNWLPAHIWSNDKPISYKISLPGWRDDYHKRIKSSGTNALREPEVEIFAFQEMDAITGMPQDNKGIYSAITSLMKAQSYEFSVRTKRAKVPVIYQFNLISVFDGRLVQLGFKNEKITATDITSQNYIASYILRKEETFARIHFVRADAFSETLKEYDSLHEANCQVFSDLQEDFFQNIERDYKRLEVLIEEFRKEVVVSLHLQVFNKFKEFPKLDDITLDWNAEIQGISILGTYDLDKQKFLNEDEAVKNTVSRALKKVYKYQGPFLFTEDIPF